MNQKLEQLLKYIIRSADNGNLGASAKKIIAYLIAICIVIAHTSWLKNSHAHNDYSLLTTVLTIDFAFIATMFGINVADKKLNNTPNQNDPA